MNYETRTRLENIQNAMQNTVLVTKGKCAQKNKYEMNMNQIKIVLYSIWTTEFCRYPPRRLETTTKPA